MYVLKRRKLKEGVPKQSSFWLALLSWKTCCLFIFKSTLHWILDQAATSTYDAYDLEDQGSVSFFVIYSRVFGYFICTLALGCFATFLAVKKPTGPQPATYGHIPMLVYLVDDWKVDDHGRHWWGDKGEGSKTGIRHAGMSSDVKDLGEIRMDTLYAGLGQD